MRPFFTKAPMNVDVETPPELKSAIYELFAIDHDPCPLHGLRDGPDGLDRAIPWGRNNFVNPPYDKTMIPFVGRIVEELAKGNSSYLLVPFRPGYRYYDQIFRHCTGIVPVADHVTFVGYPKPYMYPIVLFLFEAGKPPAFEFMQSGKIKMWRLK